LISTIVAAAWDRGEARTNKAIFSQIIHDKFVSKPSSVRCSWLDPILVYDFSQKKHADHVHLRVQKSVIFLELTTFHGDVNSLPSPHRTFDDFRLIPIQKFEGISNICARPHRPALDHYFKMFRRGVTTIGEIECGANNLPFISWEIENATSLISGPLIDNGKIYIFEMYESALSNQESLFEGAPLQRQHYEGYYAYKNQTTRPIADYFRPFCYLVCGIVFIFIWFVLTSVSLTYGTEWLENCRYDWAISFLLLLLAGVFVFQGITLWLSAFANSRSKNIRIHAVIIAELKLRDVQRQIIFTDLAECASRTAFEHRPEAFNRIRWIASKT
jgi:hypothetical protein